MTREEFVKEVIKRALQRSDEEMSSAVVRELSEVLFDDTPYLRIRGDVEESITYGGFVDGLFMIFSRIEIEPGKAIVSKSATVSLRDQSDLMSESFNFVFRIKYKMVSSRLIYVLIDYSEMLSF